MSFTQGISVILLGIMVEITKPRINRETVFTIIYDLALRKTNCYKANLATCDKLFWLHSHLFQTAIVSETFLPSDQ